MLSPKITNFFALFTSTGTLLCCALPATLAALAGGTAVTSLISAFPWLIPLSRHKIWIFLVAGVLIIVSAILTFRPRGKLACSLTGGEGCEVASGFSRGMLFLSIGIYGIGFFFAFLLTPFLRWLEG